jgi:septum formation protein
MICMNVKLVLASESPRRKDLLQRAGFFFHVFSVKVSENLEKNLTVDEQILTIARRKAEASLKAYKSSKDEPFLILAADTMVILDNVPLGKPENEEQAFEYLSLLSGRAHLVKTAVVLVEGPVTEAERLKLKFHEAIETTQVIFRPLGEREIREYISTGEPMDKAGAYGIQGFGGSFVEKYIGAFDNVVGLPIEVTRRLLREGNWSLKVEP